MIIDIKKLMGSAAIIAALAATPAVAQEADWDVDGDSMLSAEEFADGFRERAIFSNWDQDSDGLISDNEFTGGVYNSYDLDDSDGLDEAEYGVVDDGAPGYWNAGVTSADYEAWDIDGDGVVLSNEFADGFSEVGLLGEWDVDRDGALNEEEFTTGVYDRYDEDDTGIIEEPELTDIGDDMGDEGFWDV
ncbi:EF-hand domain-containing protein [Paracoccus rhizosphaerae]|uniref:EF hand n=1 Tax=Paracoccus rhizosphaerae TaxID=1133347 RepID=A0ABV6CPB1_9RHOB|nr:hypothetical protein [Paracoccus rhizosphaerae]